MRAPGLTAAYAPAVRRLALCSIVLTWACTSGPAISTCIPGTSAACACPDGLTGAQTCSALGTFGPCACLRPDAGPPDGPPIDAGPPDASTWDGGRPTGGTEGQPCLPDSAGERCGAGLECFRMTEASDDQDVVEICVRGCEDDTGCAASATGNTLCREIRFGFDACVFAEVAEGETAELSHRRGAPMTGCAAERSAGGGGLVGVARWTGSGLWALEDDQSSCVRNCNPDDPADCTARAPHCSTPFFNSQTLPGVCVVDRKLAGASCSRVDGTQMCSRARDTDGRLVCCDYLGQEPDATRGQCHQLCSIADQDCSTAHDPARNPACIDVAVSASSPDLGICSDGCSRHPDDCAAAGTEGNGMNCVYGFLRSSTTATIDNPSMSFCYDIQLPLLDPWLSPQDPGDNCSGARLQCPDGTYCETDDFPSGQGGCLVGCTTSTAAAMTGCEGAAITTCAPARSVDLVAGRCAPF